MSLQLDLFAHVGMAYTEATGGTLDNATLYREVAERASIDLEQLDARTPIGAAGELRSPLKRQIRWYQTLKQLGVIERVPGKRGIWHACSDTRHYRNHADDLGLRAHGAMQPTDIPEFFIRFLTEPGQLVVDNFGGTGRAALASERTGRRWAISEWILQYLRGSAELFRGFPGFCLHPALTVVGGASC